MSLTFGQGSGFDPIRSAKDESGGPAEWMRLSHILGDAEELQPQRLGKLTPGVGDQVGRRWHVSLDWEGRWDLERGKASRGKGRWEQRNGHWVCLGNT